MLAWLCLDQGAYLHMAQLMPLPLTISCSSKSRLVLPFWCRLTRVVPGKIQEGRKKVVCICHSGQIWLYFTLFSCFDVFPQPVYCRVLLFSTGVILHRLLQLYSLHCFVMWWHLYNCEVCSAYKLCLEAEPSNGANMCLYNCEYKSEYFCTLTVL